MGKGLFSWKHTWLGDAPLSIKYDKIFEICREKDVVVADRVEEEDWVVDLIRALTIRELHSWDELMMKLQDCSLTQEKDNVSWALDNSHKFNTRSLYRFCRGP